MRTKSFEDNDSYFKFYNRMKDKIKVKDILINEKRIIIQYEMKGEDE